MKFWMNHALDWNNKTCIYLFIYGDRFQLVYIIADKTITTESGPECRES